MSACCLLWRNFLVFYPSNPSTCLTLHPCPIPSHPHIPLGGDDHLTVIPCLAAWPIHRHLSRIHLFLPSTLSPAHSFKTPMADDFSLTDPPFRLFCILAWLVPLLDAIKPLNKWVDLGNALVIATLNSICTTVESEVTFDFMYFAIPLRITPSARCPLLSCHRGSVRLRLHHLSRPSI